MLMTVPSSPTMVAILAMARMEGRRKLRSGRISSSMTLAMARRMAATPCLEVSRPVTNSLRGMMPCWARQSLRAPSTPSFSSLCWKAGRKMSISVLALMLSMMRQMTSVIAVSDIRNMGMAKYHSPVTKLTNADMECFP